MQRSRPAGARPRNRRLLRAGRVLGVVAAGAAGLALCGVTLRQALARRSASPAVSGTARLLKSAVATAPVPEADPRVTPTLMRRLSSELHELAVHAPARSAAVYVQDIDTGLTASVNPNREFLAASLIKLPVMAATYELWQSHPKLKNRNTRAWMEAMVTVSDNGCTDRLIDLVGGPEVVTRFCGKHGWKTLKVSHAILNHRGRGGRNVCTAREMAELLVSLDRRELVTKDADAEMWSVLCRQKKRARIPAGVPHRADVQVGNKTGTLGNALHDAGIVHTSNGRYALCILLSGQRSEAAGNDFCKRVSHQVFETLDGAAAPSVQTASR
jgi:beta-lactamase class A